MSKFTKLSFLSKSAIALATLALGAAGIYSSIDAQTTSKQQSEIQSNAMTSALGSSLASTQSGQFIPAASKQSTADYLATLTATSSPIDTYAAYANSGHMSAPASISAESMARMELPASFVPNNANGNKENAPFSRIQLASFTSGQTAITALGDNLGAVAHWYGLSDDGLRQLLLTDATVHLDRKGRMLHIDAGVDPSATVSSTRVSSTRSTLADEALNEATNAAEATTTVTVTTPFPLGQTFALHSRPNSTRILYLNFVGNLANPAFSLDGSPSTFNDAERLIIQQVWQRVVEDYAPFDVDVTTEAPTNIQGKIGATIFISPQADTAGGWAYLYSFSNDGLVNPPAYCFPNNLGNSEKPIAECVSHELGHTLGLRHQGTTTAEYYYGQGNGETSWAPIMGTSYYKNLTQWAKGEYANANNKQDAYAIMSTQGLKSRPDDHGNSIPFADALTSVYANGFNNLTGAGIIETQGDVDVFSFNANIGTATFNVNIAPLGGNLDLELQIIDINGNVIATANPESLLASTITANIPKAAMYFLTVKGVGKGNPLDTGYTNYGSLGQYKIAGKTQIIYAGPPTVTLTPSASNGIAAFNVNFTANIRTVVGSLPASYEWNYGDGVVDSGTSKANVQSSSHVYTTPGNYDAVLKIVDNKNFVSYRGVKITVQ